MSKNKEEKSISSDMFSVVTLPPKATTRRERQEDPILKHIASNLDSIGDGQGIMISGQSTTEDIIDVFDRILSKDVNELSNSERLILALSGISQQELTNTGSPSLQLILNSERYNIVAQTRVKEAEEGRFAISMYSALNSVSCLPSEIAFNVSLFDVIYSINKDSDNDMGFSMRKESVSASKSFIEALSTNNSGSTYRSQLQEHATSLGMMNQAEKW